jgi:hypothetical protein
MNGFVQWFSKLNANAKGIVVVVGGFLGTVGIVLFIDIFSILFLIDTTNCGKISDALGVLLTLHAFLFLASLLIVRIWAWKIYTNLAGRLAILGVYGASMVAGFIMISFGLLVILNC